MKGSAPASRLVLRRLRAPFIGSTPLSRRHPLDLLWMVAARLAGRILARYLLRGLGGAGAYLRGSIAAGDGVFGFSDLDMVFVLPDDPVRPGRAAARVARRWQALERAVPRIARNVDVAVYEQTELERAVRAPCLRCGPDGGAGGPRQPRPTVAETSNVYKRFCVRPGLYGPMAEWSLAAGRERRPAAPEADRTDRWIAAWAELQWWWGYAFGACLSPHSAHVSTLSAKLIGEPARAWLWIVHGDRPGSRRAVLETAIARMPEEEELFRWALGLPRLVRPGEERATLGRSLAGLVRLSTRLAQAVADEVAPHGSTRVSLHGSATEPGLVPLVDWRARAAPIVPEESLALWDADPCDPEAVASAAGASSRVLYPALRSDRLLVLPVADRAQAKLRGVQCAVTDPVSFALEGGATAAQFPDVAGWSAPDSARRAVAEHARWLDGDRGEPAAPRLELAMLLTAARAALFLESVEAGSPELAVTLDAVVERLGARDGRAGDLAAEALAQWRSTRGRPDVLDLVHGLRQVVRELEPFAVRRDGA
jgi:predicted nucleotidyltransferase